MRKKRNMLKRNSGFIVGCVLVAGASFFSADILMTEVLPEYGSPIVIMPEVTVTDELTPEKIEDRTYETDPFTITASGNVIKGVESEAPRNETEELQTDEEGNPIQSQTDADGNPVDDDYSDGSGNGSGNGDGSESGDDSYTGGNDDGNTGGSTGGNDDGYTGGGSTGGNGDGYTGGGSTGGNGDGYAGSGSTGGDGDGYTGGGNYGGSGSGGGNIEIQNPGNGDYTYNSGSGSTGGSGSAGGSYGDGSYDDGSQDDAESDAWTPDDVIIPGICSRYIDVSELYPYGPSKIRIIRNEIFAVNGRIFKSQDLMDYFCQKSWYVPTYNPEDFDARMYEYLNDYELANLKLILAYEEWLATQ